MSVQQEDLEMRAKAKRSSMDIISTIPQNIIENILCLVPIKEAVRTSILSRKWKHNWITIPKLVFIEDDLFDKTTRHQQTMSEREIDKYDQVTTERITMTKRCKLFYAINQVLLLHHGPILEFTLVMGGNDSCVEIDQIIIHLARNNNTVKKFKLEMTKSYRHRYRIPRSLFALNQLTDLYIEYCDFDFDPVSSGFGSLTSLSLIDVNIPGKSLLHLLSNCPKLKSFTLSSICQLHDDNITIIRLLNCLRVIEHLSYSHWYSYQSSAETSDPRELPSALVHLKYFHLDEMMLIDKYGLEFVALVIRSSPNLTKIKLEIEDKKLEESEMGFAALQNCSDIWLEHFKELEIVDFADREGEMEFVKLILAKSPVLEKVTIVLKSSYVTKDVEIEILRDFCRCPRVSPQAEIIVKHGRRY